MIYSHDKINVVFAIFGIGDVAFFYKLGRLLLFIFFFFTTLVKAADLVLEVTKGNDILTTVAVSPFSWSGESLLSEDVAKIIDNDLLLSGLFSPFPRSNMLSFPSKESEVYYRDWRVLGVSYLISGSVKKQGGKYRFIFQLFDIVREMSILSGEVSGDEAQMRALSHKVSDAVYEKITGAKGDSSSRLLYVTANMVKPSMDKSIDKIRVPPVYDYMLKYADADGKRVRTVFKSREPIMSPCWSPDGMHVAYVSFESGRSIIYMQELSTGKRREIAAYKGLNSSPSWSPDGKRMVFMLSKDGNPDIYVMDLSSGRLSRITSHFSIDTEPDWMPDGKSIVFTSNRGGSAQIYQLGIAVLSNGSVEARGEPKRLTFIGKFNARAKVFPDGKFLAMVHKGKEATDFNIAVHNIETGHITLLTSSALEDSPSVSPGGRRLIYSVQGDQHGELGIVSVDGSVKYRLPSASGDVREPVWGRGLELAR